MTGQLLLVNVSYIPRKFAKIAPFVAYTYEYNEFCVNIFCFITKKSIV